MTRGGLRIRRSIIKLTTWNVQSLFQARKFSNIEAEMTPLGIDILGSSDTKWLDRGECK